MKTNLSKNTTFYCFTPLVTFSTFLIEVAFGLFAITRYRHTLFGRLAISMIFFLSIFQISEYMLCSNGMSLPWATIGWVSITFLPAIGLHMVSLLTKKSLWVPVGYVIVGIFTVLFLASAQLFSSVGCPGNFVQFVFSSAILKESYKVYYFLFIAVAVIKLIQYYFRGGPAKNTMAWFLAGYASFILPTAFVYIFLPVPLESFPSVFCGFAVFLAFTLATKVLPEYHALPGTAPQPEKRVLQGT